LTKFYDVFFERCIISSKEEAIRNFKKIIDKGKAVKEKVISFLTDTFGDVSNEALDRVQRLVEEAGGKFDKIVTGSKGLKKIDE